jgi:LAO/AO transport system ATPase
VVNRHEPAPRIVLAKVGLDGHDRGIRVVARGLRDAGFHVIYAGLWQSPEAVAQAVLDEDAGWLGLSLLSGAHMTLVPRVLELLQQRGLEDVKVVVGGIIPEQDAAKLKAMGVAALFGPGTTIPGIVEFLEHAGDSPARRAHGIGTADLPDLVARFRDADRIALSRLLTLALQGAAPDDLPRRPAPVCQDRGVIAFSGSGGVGKSSLIGRLVELARKKGRAVAVLCCDPESPVTGGALLGDRIRIARSDDPGVFIRSLATPSGQQAVAANLGTMAGLLRAFGFETVFVETVGAGQGDTAVRSVAGRLVVLLQPESGDELQWEKAGLLEVADVVVIHTSDLPGADRTQAQVEEQLNPPGGRQVPVVKVSAARGVGLDELWRVIDQREGNDS